MSPLIILLLLTAQWPEQVQSNTVIRLEDLPSPTCFTIKTFLHRYIVDSAKFWRNDPKKRRVFRYNTLSRYMPDAAMWEATTVDPQAHGIHLMNIRTTSFMYASSNADSLSASCRNVFLRSDARETQGEASRFLFHYNSTTQAYRIQNLATKEYLQNLPSAFQNNLAVVCLDRRGGVEQGAEENYDFWLNSCDDEYFENKKITAAINSNYGLM